MVWKNHSTIQREAGFTIPELLVAIVIIGVLGLAAFFLTRPKDVDAARNNAQRQTDVALLVQILSEYRHNNGHLPDTISTKEQLIGSEEGQADLCSVLVPDFLTDVPFDPLSSAYALDDACNAEGQQYITGYSVWRNKDSTEVTVRAPAAEEGQKIQITKSYK